jgi:hypothetical protein
MALDNSSLQTLIQEAADDSKTTLVIHFDNSVKYVVNYNAEKVEGRPVYTDLEFKTVDGVDYVELKRVDQNSNLPYIQRFLTECVQGITIIPRGGRIDPNIVHW